MAQNSKQRLVLPFMRRRRDPVSWIYDHRAGVFALLALALGMAILFVGSRIVIRAPRSSDAILVELKTLEERQQEAARLRREIQMRQNEADAGAIRNALSNEGAEMRSNAASSVNDIVDDAARGLRGNRDAWDKGLQDIEAMKGSREGDDKHAAGTAGRAKGRVMVEFSLVSPLRSEVDLRVPGYKCERFGQVVVNVVVGRGGDVVSAKVDEAASDGDLCMQETALSFARRSRFNIDAAAPERHAGTITYIFVAQ